MPQSLYNRRRDMKFFNSINNELLNNIIQTPVTVYKISTDSPENIYGESEMKTYTKGLQIGALVTHDEQVTDASEGFGPLVDQSITVAFHREMIAARGFYPEVGDIIEYNEAYFEINGIVENQLVGGITHKNFSIVCSANMTQRDKLNLENIRVGKND